MAKKTLNVGMIGYKFMGRAHSNAWSRVGMFFNADADIRMKTLCGREEGWLRENAASLGWSDIETDWRKLVARPDIDIIDITTPSNLHKEMAVEALRHGKHVFCEKPLATTAADAREIVAAAKASGTKHQVGFNYRFCPAVVLAKQLINEGKLGKIYHFRGFYLQDWLVDPDSPKSWRMDKAMAGSGAHGDLNAHVIDAARYLIGDIREVIGQSRTFITQRPVVEHMEGLSSKAGSDAPMSPVDVDDATMFLCEFENGALGSFEATRFAMGHKNDMYFEINGEKGAIKFYFERMNELHFFDATVTPGQQGWSMIQATEGMHPYVSAWWPAGHVLGYEAPFVHELYEFIQSIANDRPCAPNFIDGLKIAQVLEAVDRSIETRAWVNVNDL